MSHWETVNDVVEACSCTDRVFFDEQEFFL